MYSINRAAHEIMDNKKHFRNLKITELLSEPNEQADLFSISCTFSDFQFNDGLTVFNFMMGGNQH